MAEVSFNNLNEEACLPTATVWGHGMRSRECAALGGSRTALAAELALGELAWDTGQPQPLTDRETVGDQFPPPANRTASPSHGFSPYVMNVLVT